MGFVNGIKSRLSRWVLRNKAKQLMKLGYGPSWGSTAPISVEEWLEVANTHSKISAPVDMLAKDLATAKWKLFRIEEGEEVEVVTHEFIDFMHDPNPFPEWTATEIWRMIGIHYYYTGEGYARIHPEENGFLMSFVSTGDVMQTPSINDMTYRVMTPSGYVDEVPYDEMLVIKNPNPVDPYGRGIGVLKALTDDIEISEAIATFQKVVFRNRAMPDGLISFEGGDKESLDRLKAEWNEEYEGAENSRKMAFTSGKVTAVMLDVDTKDLDMQEGTRLIRDSILEYLRIPREIMGITENSNRSTAEASQYIYADRVLNPELKRREDAVNRFLIPLFEKTNENLVFKYDDIVPYNQEFRQQQSIDGWTNGTMTLDESRELQGLDPLPDNKGQVLKSDILFQYVDINTKLSDIETSVDSYSDYGIMYEDVEDIEKKRFQIKNVDKHYLKRKERLKRQQAIKFNSLISGYFNKQKETVIKNIEQTNTKGKKSSQISFDDLRDKLNPTTVVASSKELINYVDGLIDWSNEADILSGRLERLWRDTYDNGNDTISDIYRFNASLTQEDILKRINGKEAVKGMIDSTEDELQRLIRDTIKDDGGIKELIGKINTSNSYDKKRYRNIVDEEVSNALQVSTSDTFKANGVKRKRWYTKGDRDVRDSHRRMNGEVRNMEDTFSNGSMHPRDPKLELEDRINCRCEILPVLDL